MNPYPTSVARSKKQTVFVAMPAGRERFRQLPNDHLYDEAIITNLFRMGE
jgi:hypothetical protein